MRAVQALQRCSWQAGPQMRWPQLRTRVSKPTFPQVEQAKMVWHKSCSCRLDLTDLCKYEVNPLLLCQYLTI